MKTAKYILALFLLSAITAIPAKAQMELPEKSPKGQVMQTVGLTEITITYHSPGVKGREIFGGLVSYGEMWRTGANKATSIEFSKAVTINGTELDAGKYSLFTIPKEDNWTIIINSETELWGTGGYSKENDVARFSVTPKTLNRSIERMRFVFDDFDNESATIALEWDRTHIPFEVNVNTGEQAMKSIEASLNPSWRMYSDAASYAFEQANNSTKAMAWVNQSIDVESTWYNNWLKARILADQEDYKTALKHAKIAKEKGDEAENFFYKERVEQALEEWKNM